MTRRLVVRQSAGERLDDIKHEVDQLAASIDAPDFLLPTYGKSEDMARPHIEVAGPHMAWVVVERGKELERRATDDLDELLYWVFRSVVAEMSSSWAASHRVEEKGFRYPMFKRQLELMGALSNSWRARLVAELGGRLRDAGLTSDEIAGF